jgi:hypothetical protein
MRLMTELFGIGIKLIVSYFNAAQWKGFLANSATALIFSLLLSFASRQKKEGTTQTTTNHNKKQQLAHATFHAINQYKRNN